MRIAFISHLDMNIYLFRLSWMKAFREEGHDVFAVVPRGKYYDRFGEEGIKALEWRMTRGSKSVLSFLAAQRELRKILMTLRCDALHAFTLQGCLYGSLAGRSAAVPSIFLHVTGLGYLFTDGGAKAKVLQGLLSPLFRTVFAGARKVVFQNPDDREALDHLVPRERAVVIGGSGVDPGYFDRASVNPSAMEKLRKDLSIGEGTVVVTLIGRLLRHKGIKEFVEAAGLLSEEIGNLLFLVVGWADEGNPSVVSRKFIESADRHPGIRFLGERRDIREILTLTDIYCLPSYREGTPRTVLEAMAMERPVVTTDVPGCRQTVDDGVNGLLVPAKDASSLAAALRILVGDPDLRRRMGRAGRDRVMREFSDKVVVRQVRALYEDP